MNYQKNLEAMIPFHFKVEIHKQRPEDVVCEVCGETVEPVYSRFEGGWIAGTSPCSKCRYEADLKIKEEEVAKNVNRARYNRICRESQIRYTQTKMGFDNYEVTEQNKRAYYTFKRFAETFPERLADGRGILVYGGYGVGKTNRSV